MKKIVLCTLLATNLTSFSAKAMEPGEEMSFNSGTEFMEFIRGLRELCEKDVKYPVPQRIKEKFIETALKEVPELKNRAKYVFKELYSPKNADYSFRNIVIDPRESEWKTFVQDGEEQLFSNYYRVFIGTQCPPELETANIVPCIATLAFPAPVLVRADLREVLVQIPGSKGYVSVEEWRKHYDKFNREKEEIIVDDFESMFPTKWING